MCSVLESAGGRAAGGRRGRRMGEAGRRGGVPLLVRGVCASECAGVLELSEAKASPALSRPTRRRRAPAAPGRSADSRAASPGFAPLLPVCLALLLRSVLLSHVALGRTASTGLRHAPHQRSLPSWARASALSPSTSVRLDRVAHARATPSRSSSSTTRSSRSAPSTRSSSSPRRRSPTSTSLSSKLWCVPSLSPCSLPRLTSLHTLQGMHTKRIELLEPRGEMMLIAERFKDTWSKLQAFALDEYEVRASLLALDPRGVPR